MSDNSESHVLELTLPLAKAEGAFLALAAGDALGWPQEMPSNVQSNLTSKSVNIKFMEWTRRSGGRFQPYEEIIHAGDYSDDTQLTLAIARSRTNHGSEWWKAFTLEELPFWTLYERGGGGATKRAANAWVYGIPPWKSNKRERVRGYFQAGGNGVAMRVLPHALFLAGQETPSALMSDVVLDGSATHGHPRALVGAMIYAYAAWSLARKRSTLRFGELLDVLIDESHEWRKFPKFDCDGGSWLSAAADAMDGQYELTWDRTTREMRELLAKAKKGIQAGVLADDHEVLKDLGCFGYEKGAGTSSAAAAAYLTVRYAAQPKEGILRAAFEKGADTDTLAAMVGGLMGCLSGTEWIPQPWLKVQDARYLRDIASRIALGPKGVQQRPVVPLKNPLSIISKLVGLNVNQEITLGEEKRVMVTALQNPKAIGKFVVARAWRLETSFGQTMYVTRVERPTRETSRPVSSEQPSIPPKSVASGVANQSTAQDSKNALYEEFCRQLRCHLESGPMGYQDIQGALGLVQSQVKVWTERAQQDGCVQKISNRPVKFELQDKSLPLFMTPPGVRNG